MTSSPNSTGGFSANLEAIAKLAAGIILAFYVIGLLAINGYLFGLGASDFSLLRPRFVYTGALIGVSAIVFILVPFSMILIFLRSSDWRPRTAATVFVLSSALFPFGIYFVNPSLNVADMFRSSLVLLTIGLLCAYEIGGPGRWDDFKMGARLEPIMLGRLGTRTMSLLVCIAIYVVAFMLLYFPKIPMQFGGGKPTQVALLIKHDEIDGVRALGLPIENTRPLDTGRPGKQQQQPTSETGYVTGPLDLTYEGSEAYVLRLADGTLINIDRDSVVAIKASHRGR